MDLTQLFKTVNWKTLGFGLAYAACKVVGYFVPSIDGGCAILETIFVAGGLVSAADATRVQNVVQAVDHLLWKDKIDPVTLLPAEPAKP